VLHTWGSALTHHPHVHCIVPGGGLSPDGERWISCRPGFFLPVRVLSRLFRRLFLEKLAAAHEAGRLHFFGDHSPLADRAAFAAYLAPLRKIEWVVYSKPPSAGRKPCSPISPATPTRRHRQQPASLARRCRGHLQVEGLPRQATSAAQGHDAGERRVHPSLPHPRPARGFHRIRHYGLLANGGRAENIARARELLAVSPTQSEPADANADDPLMLSQPCPCCGGRMIIIETFERGSTPRTHPSSPIRIDTS